MPNMPDSAPPTPVALRFDDELTAAVLVAAEVFNSQHWRWGAPEGGRERVPDIDEITRRIASLVERCSRVNVGGNARVSSGRFLVERQGPVSSVWLHLADLGLE